MTVHPPLFPSSFFDCWWEEKKCLYASNSGLESACRLVCASSNWCVCLPLSLPFCGAGATAHLAPTLELATHFSESNRCHSTGAATVSATSSLGGTPTPYTAFKSELLQFYIFLFYYYYFVLYIFLDNSVSFQLVSRVDLWFQFRFYLSYLALAFIV